MPPTCGFAPKIRILTQHETQGSFDAWRESLLFSLTLDGSFEEFLADGFKWKSITTPDRGLVGDTGEAADKLSAKQKACYLKLMLGTIASYAQVISRPFITEEALSLDQIWNRLRIFYGFRKSGALVLDLSSFSLDAGESHEALWERMHAFTMDNLLKPSDGLRHLDVLKPPQELMTPTLLNYLVTLWLTTINPALPGLVKQKYTTQLRSMTLATIREEVSESLESLLAEVNGECATIARAGFQRGNAKRWKDNYKRSTHKHCPLCEAKHRAADHFLSECPFLPESDRKYISNKARMRALDADDAGEDEYDQEDLSQLKIRRSHSPDEEIQSIDKPGIRKVDVSKSPVLPMWYKKRAVDMVLDSGATANVASEEWCLKNKVPIKVTRQNAGQADGQNDLVIVGEFHIKFTRGGKEYKFDGLVAKQLNDEVIAGIPFHEAHDIYSRPSKKIIYIGDEVVKYGATVRTSKAVDPVVRLSKSGVIKSSRQTALLPGESVKFPVPDTLLDEDEVAVEPLAGSLQNEESKHKWLCPSLLQLQDGCVELVNESAEPVMIRRHEQVAVVRPVTVDIESPKPDEALPLPKASTDCTSYEDISIDPDNILSDKQRSDFTLLHSKYNEVFDGSVLGKYNGASGPLEVVINMGPTLPPQRKGKMPLYNRSLQEEYQKVCDDLEGTVLVKPEEVGITCEYLNPSFLIKKKSGKKRLVTAFGEVGQYSKPQPGLMPDVNSVLRHIGNWFYIIVSDLTSAYWQMLLARESMKYCGVVTPFRGVRVYARGAMGMPGTETALEELLSRILGDLLLSGAVAKVADDLYCGGQSPQGVLEDWRRVLEALKVNGLKLSAAKTIICPRSVSILGWTWTSGSLQASSHKLSALAAVEPPGTVKGLRSYNGSFKFLDRTMKSYAEILAPLEEVTAGRGSSEKIDWSPSLLSAFKRSQNHLPTAVSITLPRRSDKLLIITDASATGIGAALYTVRKGTPLISGHFNAKYRKHQEGWIPCEWEALSISAAVSHFSPEIVNSEHQVTVLSDSLPCVQAYEKMKKGQFSSSSRVMTFLSVISRFNVHLAHLKGTENVYSDFVSRNPIECNDSKCQVCSFIEDSSNSVIRSCSVKEVLESSVPVPFSSRSGWHELQLSDDSLRRACAHLKQGTKPSKKCTNIREVKRYLQNTRVARDGLLVVEQRASLGNKAEKIVVPVSYLNGLLECLHLKLNHPSKSQLRQVFTRAYFALNLEEALEKVSKQCHTCLSLSDMPNRFLKQSSTTKPTTIGSNFSADIVRRSGQMIFLVREYVSSYSLAKLIQNEKATTLRSTLIILINELTPKSGPVVNVKVDPASACRSLVGDGELKSSGLTLELGHPKFVNKNPVAERAIRELHSELNRELGEATFITEKILSRAVATLNSRIRGEGLSAWEVWTSRDQFSNLSIPVNDMLLIQSQEKRKQKSHLSSAVYKARGKKDSYFTPIKKGNIVYINSDRDKTRRRDRYIVTEVGKESCQVQKFTGTQLRARVYTVHRGDILTISPWVFPDVEVESDDDDEESQGFHSPAAGITAEADTENEEEEREVNEEESEHDEVPANDVTTRSGRKVRKPRYLADYTTS